MAGPDQPLSQNPIFVVGYPRSGTTLLQALLATQDNLATFPETHFFSTLLEQNPDFKETIDLESAKKALESINQKSGISFADTLVDCLANSSGIISLKLFFEALVCELFPENAAFSHRWMEKTPDHGLCMVQIAKFYPEAKFVCIVRNPLFAIYSRTRYFPPQHQDLLTFLARQWDRHIRFYEEFTAQNPSKTFLVKYEELARNPAPIISSVCEFLGLNFDQNKLDNHRETAQTIIKPFEHWKKDVQTDIFIRKDKIEDLFSQKQILKIQSVVADSMKKYGYEPQHPLMQRIYNIFVRHDYVKWPKF